MGENIQMDLKKTGLVCVAWIHLAHDMNWWWALVIVVNEPSGFLKGRVFHYLCTISFSRSLLHVVGWFVSVTNS
jgi:hypothetical protein